MKHFGVQQLQLNKEQEKEQQFKQKKEKEKMQGYEAKIKEASRELDVKERIALKDVSATQSIDDMSLQAKEAGARLNIVPSAWAIVEIHNEKSENTDYEVFVLIDENGQRYSTSSESFRTAFLDIWNEINGENIPWSIDVIRQESKNFKGKEFLTCTIV